MTQPIKMWVSHGHLQSTIDTWLPLPLQLCPPTQVSHEHPQSTTDRHMASPAPSSSAPQHGCPTGTPSQLQTDIWLPLPPPALPPNMGVPRAPPVNYRQTYGFPCPSSPTPIAAHFLVLS